MRSLFLGYEAVRAFDGTLQRGERIDLDPNSLTRHVFVCGTIGSGKTVFAKGIVEEAVSAQIPVIAIDLKGDIASLALHGENASQERLERLFPEEGAVLAREFAAGLATSRLSSERGRAFGQCADVRLFTPLSPIANRLALSGLPSFPEPVTDELEQAEQDELVASLVRGFAVAMYGGDHKRNEPSVKLLEEIVRFCNRRGQPLEGPDGIARVLQLVQSPPFDTIGGLPIADYVSVRQQRSLREGLNSRIVGAERARYEGPRLSVDTLLSGASPGKIPLSIVYLAHISDFTLQSLVIGQLCADIYRWMRKSGGSRGPKLLLYIDEIGGGDNKAAFYPSYPHDPPSKGPLNLLVKQGRSAGVSVLLATQNPMSVDVRGLGNINTWAIGRLTQRNDRDRIKDILDRMPQGRERALQEVSQLQTGTFLTISDGLSSPRVVWERWLYSVHRQLSPAVVRALHEMRPAREGPTDPSAVDFEPVGFVAIDRAPVEDTSETMTLPLASAIQWEVRCGERRWQVPAGGLSIGRSSSSTIVLDDPHISRVHVELCPDGASLVLRSMQTKNPARVDGRTLHGEERIEADGPVLLQLGSTELALVPLFSGRPLAER